MSLERDVCIQAGFPESFGGFDCRRAGHVALPSFLEFICGQVGGNYSF